MLYVSKHICHCFNVLCVVALHIAERSTGNFGVFQGCALQGITHQLLILNIREKERVRESEHRGLSHLNTPSYTIHIKMEEHSHTEPFLFAINSFKERLYLFLTSALYILCAFHVTEHTSVYI